MGYRLEEYGTFDPVLDTDSHFFINLQRLKKTTVPEFEKSYERIHDYFRRVEYSAPNRASRPDELSTAAA